MARLQFAMFHAFKGPDADAEAMIRMAAKSVRAAYPEAGVVLLTNEEASIEQLPDWLDVLHFPIDTSRVMFERIRVYSEYVSQVQGAGHVVLMDTDMLVWRRFDELLDSSADLTVTVRRKVTPINGGFYVLGLHRPARVKAFFDLFCERYSSLNDQEQAWHGDQTVVGELVGRHAFLGEYADLPEVGGMRVRYVPVRLYNQSPPEFLMRYGFRFPGARILHFKGRRKRWMEGYSRRLPRH